MEPNASRKTAAIAAGALFASACAAVPTSPPTPLLTEQPAPPSLELTLGNPIQADPNAAINGWQWVEFPQARCMNGDVDGNGQPLLDSNGNPQHTGIAIKFGRTDKALIFMQGGNACLNKASCDITANRNGFYREQFETMANGKLVTADQFGVMNEGPFADWTQVFVPYCSGDWFAGDNPNVVTILNKAESELAEGEVPEVAYNLHFQGHLNMRAFLSRVIPTVAAADQVVISGSSAGGLGAVFNYDLLATNLSSDVDVMLLNDSGPLFAEAWATPCMQRRTKEMWRYDRTLPGACEGCADDAYFEPLLTYLQDKYPNAKMGHIWSDEDQVARYFLGFGLNDCERVDYSAPKSYLYSDVAKGLADTRDRIFGAADPGGQPGHVRVFMVDSRKHVWLKQDDWTAVGDESLRIGQWVQGMLDGSSDFQNHYVETLSDPSPDVDEAAVIADAVIAAQAE